MDYFITEKPLITHEDTEEDTPSTEIPDVTNSPAMILISRYIQSASRPIKRALIYASSNISWPNAGGAIIGYMAGSKLHHRLYSYWLIGSMIYFGGRALIGAGIVEIHWDRLPDPPLFINSFLSRQNDRSSIQEQLQIAWIQLSSVPFAAFTAGGFLFGLRFG